MHAQPDCNRQRLSIASLSMHTGSVAHTHANHVPPQEHQQLITLGVEEPGISTSVIKIWEYAKIAAAMSAADRPATASSSPHANVTPLRTQKVFNSKYPESEVTALAITEATSPNLTVAVGLGSGNVYIFQWDPARHKLQHTSKLVAQPETGDLWAITWLSFAPVQPDADSLWLYVVTESQTLAFNVTDGSKNILDQQGLHTSNCAAGKDGMLVVARDDALYNYTLDTRAGCTVFDGKTQAGYMMDNRGPDNKVMFMMGGWYLHAPTSVRFAVVLLHGTNAKTCKWFYLCVVANAMFSSTACFTCTAVHVQV